SAKSLDFSFSIDTDLAFAKQGECLSIQSGDVRALFGFAGTCYVDTSKPGDPKSTQFFYEGMNQQGLSASLLWLPTTTSTGGDRTRADKPVQLTELVAYVLGTFEDVAQVHAAMSIDNGFYVNFDADQASGSVKSFCENTGNKLPLHLVVTDAKGESLVVEFSNGKTRLYYQNPNCTGILTNAPCYNLKLDNLSSFAHLNAGEYPSDIATTFFPDSNKVRSGAMLKDQHSQQDQQDQILNMLRMIQVCELPVGAVIEPSPSLAEQIDSQYSHWTVVRDHTNQSLYINTDHQTKPYKLDINELLNGHKQSTTAEQWYKAFDFDCVIDYSNLDPVVAH
ncbi:MAG: linear amide C-N hydrolase, partial [Psychrosphaera sp.]|nr:linear amide C-N hydrolase [Psychrosphaera sp.]